MILIELSLQSVSPLSLGRAIWDFALSNLCWFILFSFIFLQWFWWNHRCNPCLPCLWAGPYGILLYQIYADLSYFPSFSFSDFDEIIVAIRVSPVFGPGHMRFCFINFWSFYEKIQWKPSCIYYHISRYSLFSNMREPTDGGGTEAGQLQF